MTALKAGMDLGSRSVKIAVQMDSGGINLDIHDTVDFYHNFLIRESGGISVNLKPLGLEGVTICLTGYGREMASFREAKIISEIKAHTLGVSISTGLLDFVLLDMGGQDTKVAEVMGGRIVDFRTNDRCAASTGRYLENMARILSFQLDEMSNLKENPALLSSVCAVFGETELLSLMAEGRSREELAAGVNHALARRILPMLPDLCGRPLVITGGVSSNRAVVSIISDSLGVEPLIPKNARFMGALGCLGEL